jgi:hypothetical protein
MAGEKRLAVLLEVLLIRVQHTVQPWQKLLGTVVGVQDDWDTVRRRNCADVVGTSDSTGDRSLLILVVDALLRCQEIQLHRVRYSMYLSCKVCRTTLGHLEDDGSAGIAGSLEGSNDGGGRGNILFVISVCQSTNSVES